MRALRLSFRTSSMPLKKDPQCILLRKDSLFASKFLKVTEAAMTVTEGLREPIVNDQ